MIDILYYLSGILFFATSTYIMFKFLFLVNKINFYDNKINFYANKMTEQSHELTYSGFKVDSINDINKYRTRLIQAHLKTEEDVNKMTPDEIKKEYLKHEKGVIDKMSDHVSKMLVRAYAKSVCSVLPIDDQEGLEKELNNDVFVKSAVSEYLPPLYYKYGPLLAPITVLSTTATHVNYKKISEKVNQYRNGTRNGSTEEFNKSTEESEESETVECNENRDSIGAFACEQ